MFAVRGRGLNTQLPARPPLKHHTPPLPPHNACETQPSTSFFLEVTGIGIGPPLKDRGGRASVWSPSVTGERQVVAVIPGILFTRNATEEEEGRRFRQLFVFRQTCATARSLPLKSSPGVVCFPSGPFPCTHFLSFFKHKQCVMTFMFQ